MLIMTSLQGKIASSLRPHEQNLAGSQYGKYFVRNMNLLLLKRDPDAWRAQQSSKREVPTPSTSIQAKSVPISTSEKSSGQHSMEASPKLPSKRKKKEGDDIDKLFDSALGKRQKRSALPQSQGEPNTFTNSDAPELESIIGAIKAAPKGEKDGKHKKKKVK
jgi:nucleolar protein 9